MKRTILAAFLTLLSLGTQAAEHAHWAYDGEASPEHWGQLSNDFSTCELGKNQSPINIDHAAKANHDKLKMSFKAGQQQVENNGHTIQVNVSEGNTLQVDGMTYVMQQFHFHTPSENMIKGKSFPLEGHFVYKSNTGQLAVLALLFEKGKTNTELEHVWKQMPEKVGEKEVLKKTVNVAKLLPKKFDYYRFSGSLTTPPCSEGVVWLVSNQYAKLSENELEKFQHVVHGHNNRPVQPLNGRVVIQ
ncbi:carbonic anhydrase family protein [Neisseriaceae bacterium TC5R-5]|nr:carbonic anhydrase family protein [Neisseriaceae bacterium TC5R-5]